MPSLSSTARWVRQLQHERSVAARLAWAHSERDSESVRMGDDATGHHVGAIADTRGVMTDSRGGDAVILQVVEAGNTGAVAANPGIVEDRSSGMKFCREVGGIDSAMRGVDHDRVGGFRSDAGDAVSRFGWRACRGCRRGCPRPPRFWRLGGL